MKKLRMILLALFLVIGVSGTGNATMMTELLIDSDGDGYGDGSIQVGDKLFSEWSYEVIDSFNTRTFGDVSIFDVSTIEVIGLGADPMNPGIRFQTASGAPAFSVNGFNLLDVEFTFKVSVLYPLYQIDGVSSAFSGSIERTENSWDSVGIGDDIAVAGGPFDPWLELFPVFGTDISSDSVAFAPQSEIWVKKDIILTSDGGIVNVNWIDQNFHQTAVPEPTTMLLMGVGLLGICGVTRKKRA